MIKGRVYKSTGNNYLVKDETGRFWHCLLRGKHKIDLDITSSNPIAVGDFVIFEPDEEKDQGWIQDILPRENYIVRVSPQNRKHQQHIIASNLDQAVMVATLVQPRTSTGFIDRFLITAEAYHIPALIVYNKVDLYGEEEMEELSAILEMYQAAGYESLKVSTLTLEGVDVLKEKLNQKVSLFSGHSGVGKSSILNLLLEGKQMKTQEVSEWSGKGKHTTTFAEMMDLSQEGKIIDTPGVKEFGLINIERTELAHYFPEMRALIDHCRFNNCMHINEPGCAVKAALENGDIHPERYFSYLNILESIPENNY